MSNSKFALPKYGEKAKVGKHVVECVFYHDGNDVTMVAEGHKNVNRLFLQFLHPNDRPADLTQVLKVLASKVGVFPAGVYIMDNHETKEHLAVSAKHMGEQPRTVYHGTKWEYVEGILGAGELRIPPHASRYVMQHGIGVYLGVVPYTSSQYAQDPMSKDGAVLFIAEAVIGRTAVAGRLVRPEDWGEPGGPRIDTAVNKKDSPSILVKPDGSSQLAIQCMVVFRSSTEFLERQGLPVVRKMMDFNRHFANTRNAWVQAQDAQSAAPAAIAAPAAQSLVGGLVGTFVGPFGGAGDASIRAPLAAPTPAATGQAAAQELRAAYVQGLQKTAVAVTVTPAGTAAVASTTVAAPTAPAAKTAAPKRVHISPKCWSARKQYSAGDTVWVSRNTLNRHVYGTLDDSVHRAVVQMTVQNGPTFSVIVTPEDDTVRLRVAARNANLGDTVFTSTVVPGYTYTVPKNAVVLACSCLVAAPAVVTPAGSGAAAGAPAGAPAGAGTPAGAGAPTPAPTPAPAPDPAAVFAPVPAVALSAADAHVCAACKGRPTWNGAAGHCCRTCERTKGADHGPDCKARQDLSVLVGKRVAETEDEGAGGPKRARG